LAFCSRPPSIWSFLGMFHTDTKSGQ
jgi:hypothetical protein